MALKSYIIIADFKTPIVRSNPGNPRNPTSIEWKVLRRGDIVNGELKHSGNKPAFIMAKGNLVIPLNVAKEVITKDVTSDAVTMPGVSSSADGVKKADGANKKFVLDSNPRMKYVDAAILGAIVGGAFVFLGEKKAWPWFTPPEKINKWYGAGIGALAALYLVFRFKGKVAISKPVE